MLGAVYAVLMVTADAGINGKRRRRRLQRRWKRSASEKEQAMYTQIHDIYQYAKQSCDYSLIAGIKLYLYKN
jgi:hypothetical protein